jgi:hypothetical protein
VGQGLVLARQAAETSAGTPHSWQLLLHQAILCAPEIPRDQVLSVGKWGLGRLSAQTEMVICTQPELVDRQESPGMRLAHSTYGGEQGWNPLLDTVYRPPAPPRIRGLR